MLKKKELKVKIILKIGCINYIFLRDLKRKKYGDKNF